MAFLDTKEINNIDEREDAELLVMSINKPSVFEILVDRYQQRFFRAAFNIVKNKEEAEDIVQNAFVKIYFNAGKFKEVEGASFKSWGYRITINTALNHYKKTKRAREMVSYIGNVSEEKMVTNDLDKMQMKNDMEVLLSKTWKKIPDGSQEILEKYYLDEKSQKEIALEENTSVAAVKMRLFRAKKIFKKAIKEDKSLFSGYINQEAIAGICNTNN